MTDWTEKVRKAYHESPVLQKFRDSPSGHFTIPWLDTVEIVSAQKLSDATARIVYRFAVTPEFLNPSRNLHGGAQATFFDIGTTWLLYMVQKPGFWMAMGTTRTLNCTYIRPAPEGTVLRMECEIVHAGKRLCALKGVLMTEKDGKVISTCEHNKYNVDADAKL